MQLLVDAKADIHTSAMGKTALQHAEDAARCRSGRNEIWINIIATLHKALKEQLRRDEVSLVERQKEALRLAMEAEQILAIAPRLGERVPREGASALRLPARDSFFHDACALVTVCGFQPGMLCSHDLDDFLSSPSGKRFLQDMAEQVTAWV